MNDDMTYDGLGRVIMEHHRKNLQLGAHFITRSFLVDGVPLLVVIASGPGTEAVQAILMRNSRLDPRYGDEFRDWSE